MFHMLGRFAFTSPLSRRSSSGLSMGATRFGSCFCNSGPLKIFVISYQFIHYSQFEASTLAARSLYRRTDPGGVLWRCSATLIWGGACLITRSRSEEIHPLVHGGLKA